MAMAGNGSCKYRGGAIKSLCLHPLRKRGRHHLLLSLLPDGLPHRVAGLRVAAPRVEVELPPRVPHGDLALEGRGELHALPQLEEQKGKDFRNGISVALCACPGTQRKMGSTSLVMRKMSRRSPSTTSETGSPSSTPPYKAERL